MSEFTIESQSEFIINKADISSDRLSIVIDIKNVITDISLYEHIEKPYVTARISFVDEANLVQDADFQGGEKLTLELIHTEAKISGFSIKKEFVIDKIEGIVRSNERSEVVLINCTEYHMLESTVQNVNKAYTGAPSKIISSILTSFLKKSVAVTGQDSISDMKVIVPNMHPIEACTWLKNRMSDTDGMPYYFFSTMALDNLVLKSLGTILDEKVPINIDMPYIYAPSVNFDADGMRKYYAIQDFKYRDGENLVKLIEEGLVGAQYSFLDTLTGLPQVSRFNVETDVFRGLARDNRLGGSNKRHPYGTEYAVQGGLLTDYNSKVKTEISSSGAYIQGSTRNNSYGSETNSFAYKRKVISSSLKKFLGKAPLEITVKSREFLTGDANYTLGKLIRIIFLDTSPIKDETRAVIDHKKSGDYIVCAARHVITRTGASTKLLCGKLGSFGGEFEL